MITKETIRLTLGYLFIIVGSLVSLSFGVWEVSINYQIIESIYGDETESLITNILFTLPIILITFILLPIYSSIVWGNWFPLFILCGIIAGGIIVHIGNVLCESPASD